MTRHPERNRPKVFVNAFNPGSHFDPYYDREREEYRAHERGREAKIRSFMGEHQKHREKGLHEIQAVSGRKAPVTLSTLKWNPKSD